jgi:hypothetical protein
MQWILCCLAACSRKESAQACADLDKRAESNSDMESALLPKTDVLESEVLDIPPLASGAGLARQGGSFTSSNKRRRGNTLELLRTYWIEFVER